MGINQWRLRRQSVKDLHNRQSELYQEYLKLRETEERNWRIGLPCYEEREGVKMPERVGVTEEPSEARNREATAGHAR